MGQKTDLGTLSMSITADTSGAVSSFQKYGGAVSKTVATALDALEKIDAAIAQAGDTSGPVAQAAALARATIQAASVVTATQRQTEAAGEKVVASYERQTAAIGQTAEQLRAARAEQAALSAEQQKMPELAERIRASVAGLAAAQAAAAAEAEQEAQALRDAAQAYGLFEAAARRGIQAMKDVEAAERASAAEQHAQHLRDAAHAYDLFEAAARRGIAAMRDAEAAERASAAEQQATQLREAAQAYQLFEAAARKGIAAMKEAEAAERATAAEQQAAELRAAAQAYQMFEVAARQGLQVMKEADAAAEADARAVADLRAKLDPAGAAANSLATQLDRLRDLESKGAIQAEELAQAEKLLTTEHNAMAAGAGKNAFALREVGLQLPDIFEGLTTGQKPMQVFIQQGSQIAQIALLAEGGVKGLAASIISAMAPVAAVLAPVALAIGGLYGAFKLFQTQVKDDGDLTRYRDGLGLTHKEMLQLSDGVDKAGDKIARLSTVTVTAGDVMAGLWKTIADNAAAGVAGSTFDKIGEWAVTAFHAVLNAWQIAAAGITAGIYGTFDAVRTVWSNFPAVFGDLFVSGVNAAIEALNRLVKAGVDQLNGVLAFANKLPGVNLGAISAPQIGTIDNANAGAAAKAAAEIGASYTKAYADARAADAAFWKQVGTNARQHAMDRMKEEADALKADRTPKKPKEDKHAEALAREAAAEEAQIKNLGRLADAYTVSGAAALIAEATEKAESKAIKDRGDIEAETDRQIRLAIAQRIADAAKSTAAMTEQATVQSEVNRQVAAGLVPASEAGRLVKDQLADLPLLAALQVAQQKGLAEDVEKATKALAEQRKARADLNAADKEAQDIAQAQGIQKQIDLTAQESAVTEQLGQKRLAALRGLSGQPLQDALADINAEQEKSNILLRAQAEAADLVARGMTQAAAATLAQANAAAAAVDRKNEQDKAEEHVRQQQQQFLDVAQQFADIVGGGLGKAISALLPLIDKAKAAFSGTSDLARLAAGAGLGATAASATGGNALLGGAAGALASSKAVTDLVGKGLSSIAPSLGQFAGPIASIGAGLLTSVIGGLFQKTKKASATIESIAGQAAVASINGNSEKLKAVAGTMADSLISGLSSIADQLGGALSDSLDVSIGQRKKKFTVDLSGQGRTKGVPSFDTQDAAVAYAVQSVIQQGAITGLSAAEETLLKGKGDLQTQLNKVLSFQGVFDELKQKTDPVGYAMDQVAKKFDALEKTFKEAGASADDYAKLNQLRDIETQEAQAQAAQPTQDDSERLGLERQLAEAEGDTAKVRAMELDALEPANRAIQQRIYDLSDEADATAKATAAAQAAADLASQRRQLEIDLMTATGDTAGALAAQREDELAAMDASLRPLKAQVYAAQDAAQAAQDAADAQAKAAEAAEAAAAIEDKRRGLEIDLMTATGDAAGALAAQRADELAPLDASLRPLQQQVWAAQDAADAQAALAKAQQDAADAAQAAAEKEAEIASQRADLINQLLRATGQDAQAVANERAATLAGLPDTLKALQQQVWAAQDAQAASEAASQAAEAAAEKEQAVAQERNGLLQQLWQLTGDTASLRAAQLATLDPSNRALQQQVWAISDAQDAAKAAQDLASAWKSIGDSIKAEIDRIRGLTDAGTGGGSFASLQGQFNAAIAAARGGDQDAAKSLPDLSKSLLEAAASAATSRQELARVEAQTAAALDAIYGVINAGVASSTVATSSVLGGESNDNATTWWDSFAAPAAAASGDTGRLEDLLEEVLAELKGGRADNNAGHANTAGWGQRTSNTLSRAMARAGGDALAVVDISEEDEAA